MPRLKKLITAGLILLSLAASAATSSAQLSYQSNAWAKTGKVVGTNYNFPPPSGID